MKKIITARLAIRDGRDMRLIVAGLGLVGFLVAGCSANGTISSSASSAAPTSATASASTGLDWHVDGAYTGPCPPGVTPMPGPVHSVPVPPGTDSSGYKNQSTLSFGVPLHFSIPRQGFDCYLGSSGASDLPPGQYVVPFAFTTKNMINQQAPAFTPQIWEQEDTSGNPSVQITGQSSSLLTWESDGSCQGGMLNAGGQDTEFGFIGPATPEQLRHAVIYVAWGNNADPTVAVLAKPLPALLPNRALPGS